MKKYKFKLKNITDSIEKPVAYDNKNLTDSDGFNALNYVTRTDQNNGVKRKVLNEDFVGIEDASAITIGDTTCTIFYQSEPFIAGEHIVVVRASWLNEYTAAYIITLLNMEKTKFPIYGRAYNKTLIEETELELPAIDKNTPDWAYIEKYMKGLNSNVNSIPDYFLNEGYESACWYMDNIDKEAFEKKYRPSYSKTKVELKTNKWKPFKIENLFEISTGKDFIYNKSFGNQYPVIGQKAVNNGIACRTIELYDYELQDHENTLSLAHIGNFCAFVQEEDFYLGTRTKALKIKYDGANKYILMFLATILNYESFRYNYGRVGSDKFDKTYISLPVQFDKKGKILKDSSLKFSQEGFIPDWKFMEKYIKSLPYSSGI